MSKKMLMVALSAALASGFAFGQASQAGSRGAMSSPNAQGVQIQGNTEIKAEQANTAAVAVGQGNEAKNTAGAIKGGTQIQGNTKLKADRKSVV